MPIRRKIRLGTASLRKERRERRLESCPSEIEIYQVKKLSAHSAPGIIKEAKALSLSKTQRYTLFKYGTMMNYHGYSTRQFTTSQLCKLFLKSERAIRTMRDQGVLDEPMLKIKSGPGWDKNVWLYHQIQPVYTWYLYLKARSPNNVVTKFRREDMALLSRMKKRMTAIFHQQSGIPRPDPYYEIAGRYGVVWQGLDETD